MDRNRVYIISGGTVAHIRPHLALTAPAYGSVGREIAKHLGSFDVRLALTRMAGGDKNLETNDDVARYVDNVVEDRQARILFMAAALVDFKAVNVSGSPRIGKQFLRLKSDEAPSLTLAPQEKILPRIRAQRKDLFLVAFKTTSGASTEEQFEAGLQLLKRNSCNLVLANDVHTRANMIITPEQAYYGFDGDREAVIAKLVEMAVRRSGSRFTRSKIVDGDPVKWTDDRVPASLRRVVDHCIARGAYRPFLGVTAGHFAIKLDDQTFLTSRRKTDFNKMSEVGLVLVESIGPDHVIAHGSRPSVGGQSQRIIFKDHPDVDCIVHFHCPLKSVDVIPVRAQWPYECGSHECGQNTSDGIHAYTGIHGRQDIRAVMLSKHGPNIVFHHSVDPERVIEFIEQHWDLTKQTSERP